MSSSAPRSTLPVTDTTKKTRPEEEGDKKNRNGMITSSRATTQPQQQQLKYSYHPTALLASYQRLRRTQEDLLQRTASGEDLKMTSAATTASSSAPPSVVDDNTNDGHPRPAVSTINIHNQQNPDHLVVAAIELTGAGLPDSDVAGYSFRAEQAVEAACTDSDQQVHVVLLPELPSFPYFCQSQCAELLDLAEDPVERCPLIRRMRVLAQTHRVVLPVSVFERCHNAVYNSVVVIDADGSIVGKYRKCHIPDGTGYQEKFYFTPGEGPFQVFDTTYGRIGLAICWDQWYPEVARALALQGADVILYPTAIGSEPQDPSLNSKPHWQRVMQGHAAANMVPVVAANRVGTEVLLREDGTEKQRITFYGGSFITDCTGAIVAECQPLPPSPPPIDSITTIVEPPSCFQIITAVIDKEANRKSRAAWGLFRDRRPELYQILLTKDGHLPAGR